MTEKKSAYEKLLNAVRGKEKHACDSPPAADKEVVEAASGAVKRQLSAQREYKKSGLGSKARSVASETFGRIKMTEVVDGKTIVHVEGLPLPEEARMLLANNAGDAPDLAVTKKILRPELDIEQQVSADFARRAQIWWHSVPEHLRKLVTGAGSTVTVIENLHTYPNLQREAHWHARRHPNDETYANLPMFYSPGLNSIIIVEKPDLTKSEQQAKDRNEHTVNYLSSSGVQTYGEHDLKHIDPKSLHYAPLERSAWHELGHALDYAAMHQFTQTRAFDEAFHKDLIKLTPADHRNIQSYFTAPEAGQPAGHEYDAAKEELFAQIFAAEHCAKTYPTQENKFLLAHFAKTVSLMKSDKRRLFPES